MRGWTAGPGPGMGSGRMCGKKGPGGGVSSNVIEMQRTGFTQGLSGSRVSQGLCRVFLTCKPSRLACLFTWLLICFFGSLLNWLCLLVELSGWLRDLTLKAEGTGNMLIAMTLSCRDSAAEGWAKTLLVPLHDGSRNRRSLSPLISQQKEGLITYPELHPIMHSAKNPSGWQEGPRAVFLQCSDRGQGLQRLTRTHTDHLIF